LTEINARCTVNKTLEKIQLCNLPKILQFAGLGP
jgi:hypothetical protein